MTPLPGPILLLAIPALAALLAFLLRRWAPASMLVAAAASAGLAVLCGQLPLDRSAYVLGQEVAFGRPVVIAGRTLMLDAAGQSWLALVFGMAGAAFLLAWRLRQGRLFFSFGLILLSFYALVALLPSFELGVLVLVMGATPALFLMQGEKPGPVRGGDRYFLVTLLAAPLLLAAAWLAAQGQAGDEGVGMVRMALLPAGLGFGMLLAAFPFGTWMPALTAGAPPLAAALVMSVSQAMALYLAALFLRQAPWMLQDSKLLEVVQFAGLVTAVAGGLMAAVQRDLGRLFGYAALCDVGILWLAMGSGGSQSLVLGLQHAVNRTTPLLLMGACLALLRHRAGSDELAALRGTARRLPIHTAGFAIGGLALAGFPLTAGFATHWGAIRAVAEAHWPWALLLLASSAGIVVGLLRALAAMLGDEPRDDMGKQPVVRSALVVLAAALVIGLGVCPQLFLPLVERAVEAFALF
ncbi:MAG TPA: proton-conducting transporter membrane subunit [Anaerolineae bacterium]|nr:proton-conducting transporter membrane subunit [Anaerolineae bacterium]